MLATIKSENSHHHNQGIEYQVVYKNDSRIRVKIPRLTDDLEYAKRLQQLVESFNIVSHVRINPAASSIAVEYDASGIDSSVVQDKIL